MVRHSAMARLRCLLHYPWLLPHWSRLRWCQLESTSAAATSETLNAGMVVSSRRGEVVEIIEPFMKRPRHTVRTYSEASTDDVTIAPVNLRSHICI
ncbi:hypothetical protein K503DRAFT_537941 [Rhizopogon vinicolor AM-OR11-026]|uniref:Uncharacterized protein n=1 Tax=Rhizopogon vinicolor AM-OR11-026 TaxID=1314800 RepID=A0A1B7MKU5_9AGAM|nr:hypothetical protein K503DRAFT_537941 [Rhizopogon vinicolor AM-OR11-026]